MKIQRLSDQILILQSITIVREELNCVDKADPRQGTEVLDRLCSLYACLDSEMIANALKQVDKRGEHGKK